MRHFNKLNQPINLSYHLTDQNNSNIEQEIYI